MNSNPSNSAGRRLRLRIELGFLFLRTVRHLRITQIYHQLLYRLVLARVPATSNAPQLRNCLSYLPRYLDATEGMLSPDGEFRFLNHAHRFEEGGVNWRAPAFPKLWRYNLHYFDYLLSPSASGNQKSALIDDWIAQNPPGAPDAWEPYPISLRITNWVKYFQSLPAEAVKTAWTESLAQQATWLERRLEYHLLANHLFKNAVALVFAGIYFGGDAGGRWLKTGWRLFRAEMREQFLADGGHFERSPMYHAIGLVDCLDVLNLVSATGPEIEITIDDALRAQIQRGVEFLHDVTMPDGGLALFNDAANGIAPPVSEIFDYASRLLGPQAVHTGPGFRIIERAATGFFGAQCGQDKILIDCGPVGPDYQPGHAHCDTLSYELALNGARMIVDTGTYDYEASSRRFASRSTRGHNTVMIDGAEQSEIWGVFRVARRAKPLSPSLRAEQGGFLFEGMHDGYLRLRGAPLHLRRIRFDGQGCYEIEDTILGRGVHRADSFIHFHPDYTPVMEGAYVVVKGTDGAHLARLELMGSPEVEVQTGEYFPQFGISLTNKMLRLQVMGRLPLSFGYRIRKLG